MVSPLISALLGAGEKYMADEDASDKLKGDIIDAASKKYFDVELPNQKAALNRMKEVKDRISTIYGDKIADIGDNYGFYDDGNIDNARKRIEDFIGATADTTQTFRKKVEAMSDEDFVSAFGKTSMIGAREESLEDRETRVNNIFSDRSNMRDLLVSPDAPKGGIRGFLFGKRLQPRDAIAARGRVESELEDRPVRVADRPDAKSLFDIRAETSDLTTGFLFQPAPVDIGTQNEILAAVESYRGFGQNIQRDPQTGVITGMTFAGNKAIEYNAFKQVMTDLGPRYDDEKGNVAMTALVEAADQQLTAQTQKVIGDLIFDGYKVLAIGEKAGLESVQKADTIYSATGFKKEFTDKYTTTEDQQKAIIEYMGTLGSKSEQLYFAQSLPLINGSSEFKQSILDALR